MEYIDELEQVFKEHSNEGIAIQQKAYLKGQFEFYGIKSPLRRELARPFLIKAYLPPKSELKNLCTSLWAKPQRDFHYFAIDLAIKYKKDYETSDLPLWEHLALHNSWWDTIDFISSKLMGQQFLTYPEQRDPFIEKWLKQDNIWMKRCCILFQLKYKEKMDLDCLSYVINKTTGSKEFFINKAIGWILRERSKYDPNWVHAFIEKTKLSPLSKREASKYLKNQ